MTVPRTVVLERTFAAPPEIIWQYVDRARAFRGVVRADRRQHLGHHHGRSRRVEPDFFAWRSLPLNGADADVVHR